jgi:Na+-transporting NADH:ubiquinone oxidoreductase subunit NqrA
LIITFIFLVEAGASITTQNIHGITPLDYVGTNSSMVAQLKGKTMFSYVGVTNNKSAVQRPLSLVRLCAKFIKASTHLFGDYNALLPTDCIQKIDCEIAYNKYLHK